MVNSCNVGVIGLRRSTPTLYVPPWVSMGADHVCRQGRLLIVNVSPSECVLSQIYRPHRFVRNLRTPRLAHLRCFEDRRRAPSWRAIIRKRPEIPLYIRTIPQLLSLALPESSPVIAIHKEEDCILENFNPCYQLNIFCNLTG